MTKTQALAQANKFYSEYNIYVRGNEVIIRDNQSDLIAKIAFVQE